MPPTGRRADAVWRVSAADVADAVGIPEAEWRKTVGPYVSPRFRRGRAYTDLLLLFADTTFELMCRFGDNERLIHDALRAMAPSLADVWQDAKHAGHLRAVEVVVRHGDKDIMRFQLGAVARTLAHF